MLDFKLGNPINEVSPLRLDRYRNTGYDIEVCHNVDRSVTIVLGLKKEGYKATLTFGDILVAERWNMGIDNLPYEFNEFRTSTAQFLTPSPPRVNPEIEIDEKPIRVIEI